MLKYFSDLILTFSLLALISIRPVWSQVDNKEIVIEKEKAIQLKPAAKGFEKIAPLNLKKEVQTLDYSFIEPKISLNPINSTLRPPLVVSEKDKIEKAELSEMQGLFKVGGGNYGTLFLEGDWEHRLREKLQYGLQIRHLSAKNGPVAQDFSGWSENRLKAFGKYYLDKMVLQADIQYNRDLHRFYGYLPTVLENSNKDTLRQIFNRYALNIHASNKDAQANLQYQLALNTLFLRNNRELAENQAGLQGRFNYWLSDKLSLQADLEAYLMRAIRKDSAFNRNFFQIKPTLHFKSGKIALQAGLALATTEDSIKLYPILKAEYQLLNIIRPYIVLEGGMQRTSLSQFARQNYWLDNRLNLLHTNQLYQTSVGIRGSIGKGISYDLGLTYSRFKNLPFFINLERDTAKFGLFYDEAGVFQVGGELAYEKPGAYSLKIQSNVYSYDLKSGNIAFHRPTWVSNLSFNLLSIENLSVNLNWQILSGIKTIHPVSGFETKLSTINDLSFKVDYSFLHNFSAFLSANNMFAAKYQRYLHYPNQSINFLIGFTYGFGK
jgi:hypothetical protein